MRQKPYWLFYYSLPALFGILAIYLFISLFNKNLFCAGDGWLMQYAATEYAREFWRSVFSGSWTMLDFTIGEGLDPWVTLAYYGLTDPMTLLMTPFSHDALPTIFSIITLLKLYLSGVAFGWYASTRSQDHKAVAMGALVYTFSGFLLFWLFCPGILSAGYLFPLLLYAMDRAFDKKKYAMFAGLTLFAYVTNYYAAVAISFMLVAYAAIRIFHDKKWDKHSIFGYLKIVLAHALGIACSLFVLLPVMFALSGGGRSLSAGYSDSLVWFNWEYYLDLLISMFTPFNNAMNYWTFPYKSLTHFICLAAPALVLFLTHKTEKHSPARLLKWCLLAVTVFMCVPFFSKLMNMWMYPTHRWAFAAAMVIGMIVVWAIPRFATMSSKIKIISAIILIGSAFAALTNMYTRAAVATIIAAVITSLIMFIKPRRLTAYVAGCLSVIMFLFSTFVGNAYGAQFCFSDIAERQYHEAYAAVELTDEELEEFIRVSVTDDMTTGNVGMLLGYNTTTASWNVIPGEICDFNSNINSFPNAEVEWWVEGWDDRTALQTLAGVKYYITTEENEIFVPYGFKFYKEVEIKTQASTPKQGSTMYKVYTNNCNPGIGYMFTETLSYDAFEQLDIASKQLALMKYAVTQNATNTDASVMALELPAIVSKQDGRITIQTTVPEGYEVYLWVESLKQIQNLNQVTVNGYDYWKAQQNSVAGTSTSGDYTLKNDEFPNLTPNYMNVIVKTSSGELAYKTMRAQRPNAHLSCINPTRTACLGHQLVGKTTVVLDYLSKYIEVGEVKLYAMQTSEYYTSANKLMQNSMENIEYSKRGDDKTFISGTINVAEDGVFQLAVPYSTGWSAYVDGEKVETFVSGVKYIGINLEAGNHELRFEYETPGLIHGVVLSSMFIMLLIVWGMQEHNMFERIFTPRTKRKKA